MPQPNAPSALRLAPAVVPLVSDAMRQIIVRDYMPARDYKALAISLVRNGMATERDSEEAASAAALDACKRASDAVTWNTYTCDLFAIGEKVVSKRGLPPLPQAPWLVRDRSIETPFDINRVPWTPKGEQEKRLERYSASKQSRALAIASSGTFTFYFEQHSLDEAVRRALEACGYAAGVACRILAVDDVFVLPIPATRRAVSFFNPQASDSIAPELRDDVSRKLSNAQGGWSSVAVGSAGKIGMSVNAASETEATRSALDDCGRQDRNCRLVAIGPFAVDPM